MPVSSGIVASYVPGETTESAVDATAELVDDGLKVTLDFLGEDTLDVEQAEATVAAYLDVLRALAARGLTRERRGLGEAVGRRAGAARRRRPDKIALENARTICRAARNAGTTVTLDMEDHTTTDSTLAILRELRKDFPETGAVLQAYLHRTEADCRELAYEGSRVRLCKGAYNEPESVAFQDRLEVDKSYVRCLKVLLAGAGLPDDRHPRPADGRHRGDAGQPVRPRQGHLRVPDALRHPARRAAAAGRARARRCASTCPTAGVVRLPHETSGRATAEPVILR